MKIKLIASLGIMLLLTLGCAHSEQGNEVRVSGVQPQEIPAPSEANEVLSAGDVFELKVFNEGELSGKFRVSGAGEVTLPLVGRMSVAGLSLAVVEDKITERFRTFIKDPQISVFVEEFKGRKVYIFGRVQKPGTITYEAGMSIIEVITRAGGLHDLANPDATSITRVVDGNEQKLIVSLKKIRQGEVRNIQVLPGDIIFVPESVF